MPSKHTQKISLSDQQRDDLELIIRKRKSAQSLVLRAQIILTGAEGKSLSGASRELQCTRETVTRWRKHWVEHSDELSTQDRLKEAPRPGAPPPSLPLSRFVRLLLCLAINRKSMAYPLSHWSENSLAMAAAEKRYRSIHLAETSGAFFKIRLIFVPIKSKDG